MTLSLNRLLRYSDDPADASSLSLTWTKAFGFCEFLVCWTKDCLLTYCFASACFFEESLRSVKDKAPESHLGDCRNILPPTVKRFYGWAQSGLRGIWILLGLFTLSLMLSTVTWIGSSCGKVNRLSRNRDPPLASWDSKLVWSVSACKSNCCLSEGSLSSCMFRLGRSFSSYKTLVCKFWFWSAFS